MTTVTVTTNYRVYAGETLNFTDENAFNLQRGPEFNAPPPTLLIEGVVNANLSNVTVGSITGVQSYDAGFLDGSLVTVAQGAALNVVSTAAGRGATAFSGGSWSPDLTNHGTMTASAILGAQGVSAWSSHVVNTGLISATSTTASATGVGMRYDPVFENSGEIIATGHTRVTGLDLSGSAVSFLNNGTIKAVDDNPNFESVAVSWTDAMSSGESSFVNNGRLEGEVALDSDATTYQPHPELYTNNGSMIGAIRLGQMADTLVNKGVIWGGIQLGLGDDVYDGVNGAQTGGVIDGGDGADRLVGGAGAETFAGGPGADTIYGGGGDDVISGGRDSDNLDGGDGVDTVTYADATMGVVLNLGAGTAQSSGIDTLNGFERAVGGSFADTLTGSARNETLSGGGGDDRILAGAGDDVIDGGAGRGFLRGEDGNDTLSGGGDFDDISGNMGNDRAHGGDGDDWVVGGKDNDQLFGDAGGDIVLGNMGDDLCDGGDGADLIRGGQGDDLVVGGAGADWLSGDRGSDTLTGGAGADIFHTFADAGLDQVTDFNRAEGDRVQLDPGTAYTLGQVGGDTVIDMGPAGRMVLVGVQMTSLTGDWIFAA